MRDLVYPPVILACKTAFRVLDVRFQMTGTTHIPRSGGAVLAFNHVSWVDFIMGGYAAQPSGRLVRFMAKRELFRHKISGPMMRALHHIEVDREAGNGSYAQALDYLHAGEVVGLFPEATISRSFEVKGLKSGAVRMAADAGVPLVPVICWGTQRMLPKGGRLNLARHQTIALTVGEPMYPTPGDAVAQTQELRRRMQDLHDRTVRAYPEMPAGAWWLPASYGGSAPTLEEARERETEERDARIARRRAEVGRRPARRRPDVARLVRRTRRGRGGR